MGDIKVSIIIPCYNSAEYMSKCIESCINQSLKKIEIIMVDDCSTDETPAVIKEYMNTCPNKVKGVFLSENIRQGGARNRGIQMAQGEYIAFVDSDDWIEPDMCERLYFAADGSDLCGGDYYINSDSSEQIKVCEYQTTWNASDSEEKIKYLRNNGMFWARIYRKDFLIENKIDFPEKIYYEDAYFNTMAGLYARKVCKVDAPFYHYVQREGSTIHAKNNPRNYERIDIANLIFDVSMERGLYEKYEDIIKWKYMYMMASNIRYICFGQFDKPDLQKLIFIRDSIKARVGCFAGGGIAFRYESIYKSNYSIPTFLHSLP